MCARSTFTQLISFQHSPICMCLNAFEYVCVFTVVYFTFIWHSWPILILRCTVWSLFWSQSSKTPPYYCGLGYILFSSRLIQNSIPGCFKRRKLPSGTEYIRASTVCICTFMCIWSTIRSLILLHMCVCACVRVHSMAYLFSYESSIHYNQIKTTMVVHLRFSMYTNGAFRFPALNPTKTTEIRHFDCYISKTYF